MVIQKLNKKIITKYDKTKKQKKKTNNKLKKCNRSRVSVRGKSDRKFINTMKLEIKKAGKK